MDKYDRIARLGERELANRERAARATRSSARGFWLWLAARRRRDRLEMIYEQVVGGRRSPLVVTLPVRDVTRDES